MRDVSSLFLAFREAARHLWNTAFYRPDPHSEGAVAWDRRDAFSRVATELFSAIVLEPLGATDRRLAPMWEHAAAPLTCFEVDPSATTAIPIMINRASPLTGYWDDPVSQIAPGEARMQFVSFFDWDELGFRDFQYVETLIVDFPAHPGLVGRYALIQFGYASFRFIESTAA
jgi:hypothetical protein